MSFPAAAAASATAIAATNPLDVLMAGVNSNPYFIGIMMLLLNLGGRFLALEISKDQEKFLSHPVIRRFFLFAVLFVATRNVIIAAGLTVIVIFVLGYLFNENSELCLWKSCITPAAPQAKAGAEGFQGLSSEEEMILKRLQDKQTAAPASASAAAAASSEEQEKEAPVAKAADIYNSVLTQISSASS
jgi:hypothetical protein